VKDFLTALSFLTILPAGRGKLPGQRELARSMAFFPLVGLVIGGFLALAYYLLSSFLPKTLAIWLTIGFLAFLTRGLHLDGFADTMDGLACGGSREKILEVMRDSRIGAFGVISLVFLIGAQYFALDHLSGHSLSGPLILMVVLGKASMVLVCYRSPYARSGNGLAKPFTENLGRREIAISSILTIGISWVSTGLRGWVVFLGVCLFSLVYRRLVIRRLGGITGDVLGAANELSEILSLLLLVILEVLSR
jgi:adenosylcobinamide-GDP ribazoletransferase